MIKILVFIFTIVFLNQASFGQDSSNIEYNNRYIHSYLSAIELAIQNQDHWQLKIIFTEYFHKNDMGKKDIYNDIEFSFILPLKKKTKKNNIISLNKRFKIKLLSVTESELRVKLYLFGFENIFSKGTIHYSNSGNRISLNYNEFKSIYNNFIKEI